ncbi:Rad24 protein [Martiniozyma asiatica (nom. inval.)]|nr:Rad24 protein [Martiniozyma asiatica]
MTSQKRSLNKNYQRLNQLSSDPVNESVESIESISDGDFEHGNSCPILRNYSSQPTDNSKRRKLIAVSLDSSESEQDNNIDDENDQSGANILNNQPIVAIRSKTLDDIEGFLNKKRRSQLNFNSAALQSTGNPKTPETKQSNQQLTQLSWVETYSPTTSDRTHGELCIHPKKIDDLRKKLKEMIYGVTNTKILVLSGPTGSGKSTAAKLICNELMTDYRKSNTKNGEIIGLDDRKMGDEPVINSTDNLESNVIEFNYLSISTKENSSVNYFGEFLEQCKMLTGKNEKCILIEELPNIYHRETHLNFQNALLNWLELSEKVHLPPLVICITEYDVENDYQTSQPTFSIENTFKVETVLGYKLMQMETFGWDKISFNPVAKTYIKKALLRIVKGERLSHDKYLSKKIDEFSNINDLRNSITVFEYWVKFLRHNNKSESSCDILGKEEGINIFHTVGKLIYGTQHHNEERLNFKKRKNLDSLLMGDFANDVGIDTKIMSQNLITAQLATNEVASSLTRVNLCCLESYNIINPSINKDLCLLLEDLSLTDNLCHYTNDYTNSNDMLAYQSCLSIRLACSKLKTGSKKGKILFTRDSKVMKRIGKVYEDIINFQSRRFKRLSNIGNYSYLSELETITMDGFYQSLILSSFKTKQKHYMKGKNFIYSNLSRLGGNFNNTLYADDGFKIDSDDDQQMDIKRLEDDYFGIIQQEAISSSEESDPLENTDADDSFSDDDLPLNVNTTNSKFVKIDNPSLSKLPKIHSSDDSFSDDDLGLTW